MKDILRISTQFITFQTLFAYKRGVPLFAYKLEWARHELRMIDNKGEKKVFLGSMVGRRRKGRLP